MPPWLCFARDNPLCLSFAVVHSTTPATGPFQDLVGLDQNFLEVLTQIFAKNECGLEFFAAVAPTSSDVPWDTVMFHSVQAAAASAPRAEFPAVHPDPWFLKHRCSNVTTQTVRIHPQKGNNLACTGDRVSQFCWITHERFVCPKRCSEHHKDMTGFGQRKLPKANCTPLKDSLQPAKKKSSGNLADWTGFAQIIYRCNSGRAQGTGNFAISAFGCLHTTWKKPSPKEL